MKKTYFAVSLCLVILLAAGLAYSASGDYVPPSKTLHGLLKKHPEVKTMLEASISEAKKVNPDTSTNPVQSLDAYYKFVDKMAKLAPGDVPRLIILQQLCYFYFLVDQPLDALKDKNLFKPAIQYYPPFSKWLWEFAKTWGAFLSTPESWSEKQYKEFYNDPAFGLQKGWYESPKNWKTFNDFFSRKLKDPLQRPVAFPDDTSVVVSPADSVPQGVWPIDKDSKIMVEGGLKVKLATYYSIKQLLGEDSEFKDAFANGVLTHTFLNVNDYHRYRFAVGGVIKEKKNIIQNVALEVKWNPKEKEYDPIDSTGWQFTQTRGYVIVDMGKTLGVVALMPMGMAHVSSVNFEDNVKVGESFKKGAPLGYFLFGGSDFVMLFQKQAGFKMTTPAQKHILANEKYGKLEGASK